MQDLGVDLDIRVFTDATTGKSIASTRRLRQVRHIATHELWIQQRVMGGNIEVVKIQNWYNVADINTEYLTGPQIDDILEQMRHIRTQGRNAIAPALSMISDHMCMPMLMLEALACDH